MNRKKMKVTCISASNMKKAGGQSTSLIACQTIEKIIKNRLKRNAVQVEIIKLVDAELKPCTGCGQCYEAGKCAAKDDFNAIYTKIAESDAVFIVSPHYAPIPAKLSIVLEKMEQPVFLHWFRDNSYRPKVHNKPVGIIAHGGGSEEWMLRSYKELVLDTISNALQTIMMDVVGRDEKWPTGVVFPVKEVRNDKNSLFPIQTYDWAEIENRLTPLVEKVIAKAERKP
jgi:multimeric flavodoxin WrbA